MSCRIHALCFCVFTLLPFQITYFGARDQSVPYFTSLGYICPPFTNEADYLREWAVPCTVRGKCAKRSDIAPVPRRQRTSPAFREMCISMQEKAG